MYGVYATMTTWLELIQDCMDSDNDSFDNVVELHIDTWDLETEIVKVLEDSDFTIPIHRKLNRKKLKFTTQLDTNKYLLEEFDNGYGTSEGYPFTLWTKTHVYFPVVYDGSEWVESVPRNPPDTPEPKEHVGGE